MSVHMPTDDSPSPSATPPPRTRRRDAATNHEALLHAAQAVLAENPHASLDAIAHAAGLSRRALYGHFADRESLLREVIAIGAERFNLIAEATADTDPRIALARMAARLWHEVSTVRALANITLDDHHVADTARALEPLRRRVREITNDGVRSGVFRQDMTPEVLAFLIEETARSVLRGLRLETHDAGAIVAKVILSVAGLSWAEQAELDGDAQRVQAGGD